MEVNYISKCASPSFSSAAHRLETILASASWHFAVDSVGIGGATAVVLFSRPARSALETLPCARQFAPWRLAHGID